MSRAKNETDERRIKELFAELRRRVSPATDNDLRTFARSAAAEPRQPNPRQPAGLGHRGWRLRLRWASVAVAAALLIGSGFGFGLGSRLTPSVNARTDFVGLGFLPARGWTVTQSGLIGPSGEARAIAANVPLHPDDNLGGTPLATLESLPANGVVIFTTFTPRGDPGQDFTFVARALPLRIASNEPLLSGDPLPVGRPLTQYSLRAAVGAYNVDVEIYLGAQRPSPQLLAAAQRQLSRLVVASERVTIFARPGTLFGSVDNRRAGEAVTIQAKDCGQPSFRVVAGATTVEGGGWSTSFGAGINTTVRAVWKNETSAPIAIREAPRVGLVKRTGSRFEAFVTGRKSFWRKRVLIQRFDRRLGTWLRVRSVVLTETYVARGYGYSAAGGKFRLSLPKGTLVRAFLPLSEARPCYIAGVSLAVRT